MSAGFSPGPWAAEDTCEQATRWAITAAHPFSEDHSLHVARQIDVEADAHLIAAAPDLYEALWKIARVEFNCSPHQRFMAAQAIAEEALAKARGEQA